MTPPDAISRRRGRPPLDVTDKRQHTVSARLNPAELATLDQRRSRVNMERGEYLRTAALSRLPPSIPEINRQAWIELARLAANINQIARHLNEGGTLAETIGAELQKTQSMLKQVRNVLIGSSNDEGEN